MRTTTLFNDHWTFVRQGKEAETVNLPHTWNAVDGQDGGDDYFRGTGTYTKTFARPQMPEGGRVYLEFRGVNSSARVAVNGREAAKHDGGYSTFRADITELLSDENTVEVVADNAKNDRVYPQKADFTFYGGIYRDVYLVTVPAAHFDMDYYGGCGVQVTPVMEGKNARVEIKAYVTGTADSVRMTVRGAVDAAGKGTAASSGGIVGTVDCPVTDGVAEGVILIENAHLWDGVDDPYLYQAQAELMAAGETIDEVSVRFGCRSYSFDSEKGFFLNGRPYPLHGVSRHQDRKGVGNALTKEMHREDMDIICSMGANALRLAHYQHDQYFYDLCDERGMVVWAEIPYISRHMPDGRENTLNQMRELITQNYNHPSIICWALSNEISLQGVTEDLLENHRMLNDLAHEMDKTRVTAMANLFMLETDSPLLDIPDIMSYNLYYGWYVGELEDNDAFFDKFHSEYPDKVIGLSEYGADTHYTIQSPNPIKGDYSEQYQALYHEHMLEMFAARPYLWSTFVWNMFDFAADAREEAGDNGVNHKGLVSFDRRVYKDAFYIYKAWWSKEPFVHLCGSRYVDRAEEETEIKVYSNQPAVSLYVDGACVGTQEGSHVFTFRAPISGEHHVEARSGSLTDAMDIRKVSEPNPAYRFKDNSVKNWFEVEGMEIIPGFYSIKDTMGDIRKSPQGAALLDAMMAQMQQSSAMASMAEGVEITPAMMEMTNRMPVEKLIQQGASDIDPQMIVMLNKQLNKIPKPEGVK